MYVPRLLTRRLRELARTFPVVVVVGARQVGKSTLLQKTFGAQTQAVVFDPVQDIENARRDSDLFLANRRTPLILDEVQYAPEVIAALKRRVDRDRKPGQYFLTGSQQWGVLKTLAESLAGRAVFVDLDGFALVEAAHSQRPTSWLARWLGDPTAFLRKKHVRLPAKFSLFEQLWRGWLPEAQFLPLNAVPDFHAAYQRTYIERDVRMLANVSDWQLFGRFVRLISALTAQEINYSQLGRELGLNPQTAKSWLDMLQATFQWFDLPPYHGNAIKRISGKPKGYMGDTGLACSLQAIATPEVLSGHPMWGAFFETAAIGEVRKQLATLSPKPNLYHWRSHGGAEVDLLVEYNGIFHPLEVKAASRPGGHDARGLSAFRDTYPKLKTSPGLILAPAETIYPVSEQDWVVPWDLK